MFSLVGSLNFANVKAEDSTSDVNKAEFNARDEQYIDEMFRYFDPSEKILQLPDGAFLQGKMVEVTDKGVFGVKNLNITGIYDSETDSNSISVEEAKELVENTPQAPNENIPVTRGSGVSSDTKYIELDGYYMSNEFSGSGWRFSGYTFRPTPGTGDWLTYTSLGDSGRAGTAGDAQICLNGGISGTELKTGVATYVNSKYWTNYFTHNPLPGTRYLVQNI